MVKRVREKQIVKKNTAATGIAVTRIEAIPKTEDEGKSGGKQTGNEREGTKEEQKQSERGKDEMKATVQNGLARPC